MSRIFIRGSRFSPTGIDRVVMAYGRWFLSQPDIELQPVLTFGGRIYGVPRHMLERTIRQNEAFAQARDNDPGISSAWGELRHALSLISEKPRPLRAKPMVGQLPKRAKWHLDIIARALAYLRPIRARRGSIYVNVSHTGLDQPRVLARLRESGVAPVVMVHDLIPIGYPEYCAPGAEARHLRRIREVIDHAALVITNSATTADDLSSYARDTCRLEPAIEVAPLGLEVDFLNPPSSWSAPRPYFVCVGTLEARKNIAFLLTLWRKLAERRGSDAPRLVLVGRRGWENESVLDHLQRSKAVINLVHEVSDLTDQELAQLVSGATALLSPSLAEGFDLPVVEALSLRTPVIASDIPVHRELAGGSAKLVDALDGPAWLDAIDAAITSNERGPYYAGPTWAAHFEKVRSGLSALATQP